MQEQQVTVDGVTRELPRPFMVLATQNPIEYEGTFILPEAQLDRFFMRISMGYPSHADEKTILVNLQRSHPIHHLKPVQAGNQLLDIQHQVWEVHVDETLQDYIVRLVNETRHNGDLVLGGSPRASLALFKAAQGLAALRGRDHVLPDDIKTLAPFVLAHRLIIRPEAELRGKKVQAILENIVESVPLDIGQVK
jgi:MoxR-like ATPase